MARQCFQVGDRVVSLVDYPDDNINIMAGDTGTVCYVDGSDVGYSLISVGVKWDKDVEGHSCGDTCEYGFGWNICSDEIELQQPDMTADADEVDAFLRDMGV